MRCTAGDRKIHSELVVGLAIGRGWTDSAGSAHGPPSTLSTHSPALLPIETPPRSFGAPRPAKSPPGGVFHITDHLPAPCGLNSNRTYVQEMDIASPSWKNLRRSIAMLRVGAPAPLHREAANAKPVRELQALEGQIRRLRAGMQRSWTIPGPTAARLAF